MKKTLKFAIVAMTACFAALAFAQDATKSMRGIDVGAADEAAEVKEYAGARPGKQTPIVRTFSTQPPVVPHAVERFDEINLEGNQCLDCHGAANYKKANAPKIGDSHFVDRNGKKHEDATNARYNCTQCHVPQIDAPALVESDFKGDKLVKKTSVKKN